MLLEMRAEGIITVFNKQLVGIFCMYHLKEEVMWVGLAVVSTTHISTVALLLLCELEPDPKSEQIPTSGYLAGTLCFGPPCLVGLL